MYSIYKCDIFWIINYPITDRIFDLDISQQMQVSHDWKNSHKNYLLATDCLPDGYGQSFGQTVNQSLTQSVSQSFASAAARSQISQWRKTISQSIIIMHIDIVNSSITDSLKWVPLIAKSRIIAWWYQKIDWLYNNRIKQNAFLRGLRTSKGLPAPWPLEPHHRLGWGGTFLRG